MKITNMEQVKENIGKRVVVKFDELEGFIEGELVEGEFIDCKGDSIDLYDYSIRFDKTDDEGCTLCSLDNAFFDDEEFLEFEVIE